MRRAIEAALRRRESESGLDIDPLTRLESLDAPTGDIEQMLAEIESGRA